MGTYFTIEHVLWVLSLAVIAYVGKEAKRIATSVENLNTMLAVTVNTVKAHTKLHEQNEKQHEKIEDRILYLHEKISKI